jgi:hypothetical protein
LVLGSWKLYEALFSDAQSDPMALPLGLGAMAVSAGLSWIGVRTVLLSPPEPKFSNPEAVTQSQMSAKRKRVTKDRPTRSWLETRWGQWVCAVIIGIVFLVGDAPKDRYGRPMKLRVRGGVPIWVENHSAPMPKRSNPLNPSFDNIRKELDVKTKANREFNPDVIISGSSDDR